MKKCFVIMPFSSTETYTSGEWEKFYSKIIKPNVEACGYACHKSEASPASIIDSILSDLLDADVVLAVLTDMNANVLYELGTRHALRRGTIMILKEGQRIPFDISSYGLIIYNDSLSSYNDFQNSLRNFFRHIEEERPIDSPAMDFLIKNKHLPSKKNNYWTVDNGFQNIVFPHDIKLTDGMCHMLVIGISKDYIPNDVHTLIQAKKKRMQLLVCLDETISNTREHALGRDGKGTYYGDNMAKLNNFITSRRKANCLDGYEIHTYERYPFGLYLHIDNYIWFAPLWNRDDPRLGSAIKQTVMMIEADSTFGKLMQANFTEIWNHSVPYIYPTALAK